MYVGPLSAEHLLFLQNASRECFLVVLSSGLTFIVRIDVQTGHSPPPWTDAAVGSISGYPSAWGYALRRHGEPIRMNASPVGPGFDGRDLIVDPIIVLTPSTVSPAYIISSSSSRTAISSLSPSASGTTIPSPSSPACPGTVSSVSSTGIPQNKTPTANANAGSFPPVPQQGVNLPFTMSESAVRGIGHQTAAHAPYSTLSAHDDPSSPAESSNYPPPGHQHPPSMYSPIATTAPATSPDLSFPPAPSPDLSFAPARQLLSGYAPPPRIGPFHWFVPVSAPPPVTGPVLQLVPDSVPPAAVSPTRRRMSGSSLPPPTGPVRQLVSGSDPPPADAPARPLMSSCAPASAADPARHYPARQLLSGYAPLPAGGSARPPISSYAPPPTTDPGCQLLSGYAPPTPTGPVRQLEPGSAPPPPSCPARPLVSSYAPPPSTNLAHPLAFGSAPQLTTDPAHGLMSDPACPALRAVTQDIASPRTLSYHNFVPDPLISTDTVDTPVDFVSQWTHHANLEMRREKTRQLQLVLETKIVDQKTMEMRMQHSRQNTGSPATLAVRHTRPSTGSLRAPSQTCSSLSLPYGPSPASSLSPSLQRRSDESIAFPPYHSNSSIDSVQLDRLIVKPVDKPANVPDSDGQGYSGDDKASVDGGGAKTWTLANEPNDDKTCNIPDRYGDSGRYKFASAMGAMDGSGHTIGGFASATNGHIRNGRVKATSGHSNAIHEHVHDRRDGARGGYVDATIGNVRDERVHAMAGYGCATTERVHHPFDRYDNDEATRSRTYENADGTYTNTMHANVLSTSGPVTNGI